MQKLTKKTTAIIVLLVFICFGLGRLAGGQLNYLFFPDTESAAKSGKIINILFMGIDARDAKSNSRSDTMILASIDTKNDKIALLSVPRDTRIKSSNGSWQKINSVNLAEGPQAACKVVGNLLNTNVPYYVVTNFTGFSNIIDTLGGIDINVEMDMHHADPIYPQLAINISKGQHHLNGQQALAFVRYRGGPTADIGRTQRQQQFIKALVEQMSKVGTILKLPQIIPEITDSINTNMSMKDMLYLAGIGSKFDAGSINTQTLPGYSFTDPASGASYWEADKKITPTVITALLNGEHFNVASDPPQGVKPVYTPAAGDEIAEVEAVKSEDQAKQEEEENKDKTDADQADNNSAAGADAKDKKGEEKNNPDDLSTKNNDSENGNVPSPNKEETGQLEPGEGNTETGTENETRNQPETNNVSEQDNKSTPEDSGTDPQL